MSPPAALARSQVPRAGGSIYPRWELPWTYRMRSPCRGIEWAAVGSPGRPRWWQGTGWWHGVR